MSPNTQKTMPKRSSLWPSIPRKLTCERSGTFKAASPPASSAADAAAPVKRLRTAAATLPLANLLPRDQALASQVRIKNPPSRKIGFRVDRRPAHSFPAHYLVRQPLFSGGGWPCRISKDSHLKTGQE